MQGHHIAIQVHVQYYRQPSCTTIPLTRTILNPHFGGAVSHLLPPTRLPLPRLAPNLHLLLPLKPSHLPTVLLILPGPMFRQPLDILHKSINSPCVKPVPCKSKRYPKRQLEYQGQPEHDGTVRHTHDLERDEEDCDEHEDRDEIGLGRDADEGRGEMCLQRFEEAEGRGYEGYEGVEEGGREKLRGHRYVVLYHLHGWQCDVDDLPRDRVRCGVNVRLSDANAIG